MNICIANISGYLLKQKHRRQYIDWSTLIIIYFNFLVSNQQILRAKMLEYKEMYQYDQCWYFLIHPECKDHFINFWIHFQRELLYLYVCAFSVFMGDGELQPPMSSSWTEPQHLISLCVLFTNRTRDHEKLQKVFREWDPIYCNLYFTTSPL